MRADIEEAMRIGTSRYADALAVLQCFGPAFFTQTGGMCAALEVTLERGVLLITDEDDTLPWQPSELRGWGVGFYVAEDASDGPTVFASSGETDLGTLRTLVERCLREVVARRTTA